jgi:hypothetical protein
MSKACMVVSDISCHCIWTNTDYYNNKKRCLPALSKFLEYWPEKLIIFVCLALSTEPYKLEQSMRQWKHTCGGAWEANN